MIIWSSNEAYVVDALAARGDEGRGRLRKASGSSQTCFDPEISEWGNPTSSLNSFNLLLLATAKAPCTSKCSGDGRLFNDEVIVN